MSEDSVVGIREDNMQGSCFPGEQGDQEDWVCAKIPHDGSIKKDCVPKVQLLVFKSMLVEIRLRESCSHKEERTYTSFKEVLSHYFLVCFAGTS